MSDDRTSHAIDERYSAVYDAAVELVDPHLTRSNHPDSAATEKNPLDIVPASAVVVASERADAGPPAQRAIEA